VTLPLVLIALAGCGSSSKSSSSTSSPSSTPASTPASTGSTVQISMKNIQFNPATAHAKVGQTVVWTNDDGAIPHNVTYVSGPTFTSSSTFNGGGTFKVKLTKAGTIQYRCTIHPTMTGTLVVSP
jgi:plastocyanin